jgi:hypothetical protein
MAGELWLMRLLAAGHLIKARMQHNRSEPSSLLPSRPTTPAPFATIEVARDAATTSDTWPVESSRKEERITVVDDELFPILFYFDSIA